MANGGEKGEKADKSKPRRGSRAQTSEESVMQLLNEIKTEVRGNQHSIKELK